METNCACEYERCEPHVGLCVVCHDCYGCIDKTCRCLEWKADRSQAYIDSLPRNVADRDYCEWYRAHADSVVHTTKPGVA
jgi:hypothetical protein